MFCSCVLFVFVSSDYYTQNCAKVALGIDAATGLLMWVSRAYFAKLEDDQFSDSSTGMLECLGPGQQVMTDKGFLISAAVAARGARLLVPPKKKRNRLHNS